MDDCLTILFTGPCAPVGKDFKRTPLLVRRKIVHDALEWLRLNHSEYHDMEICHDSLNSYSEVEPPVHVFHLHSDGTTGAESMAVYENDEEDTDIGTDVGNCSFAVSGLTGAVYDGMSIDERKCIALQHMASGGKVLAYGHSEDPTFPDSDSHMYPSMFPWLFPYGMGGFANEHIEGRLDHIVHVRWMLMYHDRRFQTDEYFPMIVFNRQQIKAASRGGYLLTERKNFSRLAEKLFSLDSNVLNDLCKRSQGGSYVKPQNDSEKQVFEIMQILDHVACHVKGSNVSRKYMRNEIRSLVYQYGAPVFDYRTWSFSIVHIF